MSDDDEMTRQQYNNIISTKTKPLFVKFTAGWCGPCKKIKPIVDAFLTDEIKSKINYLEIDIDNSIDVYSFMKSKKQLNGIPTLFYYETNNRTFAPDLSVSTGSTDKATEFLNVVRSRI